MFRTFKTTVFSSQFLIFDLVSEIYAPKVGEFFDRNEFIRFRDVTADDRKLVATSGFRFPVQGRMNRSTCSGVFAVSAYFRSGGPPNLEKNRSGPF